MCFVGSLGNDETDRQSDGKKEGSSLIRLTGVGTSGGWGVGARGGDRSCLHYC